MAQLAQRRALAEQFKPTLHVVLDRSCDATPRLVSFGRLAETISGHARYAVKNQGGNGWQLATKADFGKLRPRCKPKYGVVEILAQSYRLRWLDPSGRRRSEAILVPPCGLADVSASTLWTAVEAMVPEYNTQGLAQLCVSVPIDLA